MSKKRTLWLLCPLLLLAGAPPATAQRGAGRPVLHEPIPPDPEEDMALALTLDGDLPAAIRTPRGVVAAPDPARPVGSGEAPYGPTPNADAPGATFRPDRDTRRPDMLPYDDPFTPSTAPFKRLSAYDHVNADYTLSVREGHAVPLAISTSPPPNAADEHFFADMEIDLTTGQKVRIPSVGPGARVLRARAGVGAEDVKFTLFKDGADNWFIEGESTRRVRLVMELSIPRAAFGGDFGDPTRAELRPVAPLAPNVRAAAAEVAEKLGISHRTAPREIVSRLVANFRSFHESDEPLAAGRDIYLDLALGKKGVCRHRSFAFLVTALYLRIPTRMITNEAHAWVEVHDGRLWRRIDLGGAGRTLRDPLSTNVPYTPPPDPFGWPHAAARGDDLADRARRTAPRGAPGPTRSPGPTGDPAGGSEASSGAGAGSAAGASNGSTSSPSGSASNGPTSNANNGSTSSPSGGASNGSTSAPAYEDRRPASLVTIELAGAEARRGAALAVRGRITSEGRPCGHVPVQILLRSGAHDDVTVGALATDDHGDYDGALVLPTSVPLGDYEVRARTPGDARCGVGETK